jgi:outer membrane lipoprotein-sorting protein
MFDPGALLAPVLFAAAAISAADLLRLADRPRESYREAIVSTRVTVIESGRETGMSEFDVYRKDGDRALIVFTGGKQKGRKILTVGDKFWLIVPGSSRAIPVTSNQRLVGGASFGDVARLSFAGEFTAVLDSAAESVEGRLCDVLNLAARRPSASYASGRLWIDRQDHLARRALLALASGKPAKEVAFEQYDAQAAGTVLRRMTTRDLLDSKGVTSRIEYTSYRKAELPDSLFTPEGALRF